ncbi:MAG: response regulator [Melioribacteraceae bacterium]|nr:response regulator [Melioribacteraceae bacterium]
MKKSILVADDSPTIRKFVSFTLAARGFKITSANDGMEALELLPSEKFDLIITDLNMPNIDGFEFIRTVRQSDEYRNIPIIILSSLGGDSDIDEGLSCGANSYLRKPFDPNRIAYEVSKYLN